MRCVAERGAGGETEAWVGRSIVVGILESVPPSIDLSEVGASNSIPVCLCVLDAWLSTASKGTADGPSSLSDPNWLSTNSGLCSSESIVEETSTVLDGVGLGALEVWVAG